MPRYALRPVDPRDPRPTFADDNVLTTTAGSVTQAVITWAKPRAVPVDAEQVKFAVVAALKRAGADAFRLGVFLQTAFGWPVDYALVHLLDHAVNVLPQSLTQVTAEWAVRTGLRFPAKTGDTIEYVDVNGAPAVGIVKALAPMRAAAFVLPVTGDILVDDANDTAVTVNAEDVFANVTTNTYTPIDPPLGVTYVDAPALGAAWEAERVRAAKTKSPTDAAAPPKTAHPLAGLRFDPFIDPSEPSPA